MNFDLNFLYGIVYTLFLVIAAVVVVAAMIWRKFRTFLIEELSAKLVSPLKQEVNSNEERLNKLERLVETAESLIKQNYTQKFSTVYNLPKAAKIGIVRCADIAPLFYRRNYENFTWNCWYCNCCNYFLDIYL